MPRRRTVTTLGLVALALTPAGPAHAAPFGPDAALLVDGQSDLLTPLRKPDGDARGGVVSDDGRYVLFEARGAQDLSGDDDDDLSTADVWRVYRKDRRTGAVTYVSRSGTGRAFAVALSDDGNRAVFGTDARLSPADTNDTDDLYVRDIAAGTTTLASVTSSGAAAGDAYEGAADGDASVVAFITRAAADAGATDGNADHDVYARDLAAGTTALVSRGTPASAVGGSFPSVDDAGTTVLFLTDAPLAGALDTNGTTDAYLRVLSPGSTQLASRVNGGGGAPNGSVITAVLSGDGSTIAWETDATDIGDGDGTAVLDIHRSALGSGTTSLVSRNSGGDPGDADSRDPSISDDGRTVAFTSVASNLDSGRTDTDGAADAFVRRSATNATELSSIAPDGGPVSEATDLARLSGDGRHVVVAGARALAPDLDPRFEHVVVRDQSAVARITETISRPPGTASIVNPGGSASMRGPQLISSDGRYVAFTADAPGLASAAPGVAHAYRRDLRSGEVVLVSATPAGDRFPATAVAISDDGRRVLLSTPVALDPGADTNTAEDLYLRDLTAGTVTLVSRADGPAGAAGNAGAAQGALSRDGSRVAWQSAATDLVGADTSPVTSVFVRDLAAASTILASRDQGPVGATNTAPAAAPGLDGDGSHVAFVSAGGGYGDGGSGATGQIHVRDLGASANTLVSAAADGTQANGAGSAPVLLSADGRLVAYSTAATNLTPDDTDTAGDVVVTRTSDRVHVLASRADGPTGPISAPADLLLSLSGDGRRVLFRTTAAALAPGVAAASIGAYVRDLDAGTTRLASRGPSGAAFGVGLGGTLSADGRCAAMEARYAQIWARALDATCAPAPPPEGGTGAPPVSAPGAAGSPPGATPLDGSDRRAPTVAGLRLSARRTRTGRVVDVRLRLDERARVRIVLSSIGAGRRVGRTCRLPTRALRRRPACERRTRRSTATRTVAPGSRRITLRARTLRPGRYVATVTATDAAGNRSVTRQARFRIRR